MAYRDLLPLAIELAVKAHGTTLNKDGTLYILHPLRLMMQAESHAEKIVAILHDTVEDTWLSLAGLIAEGFPAEIVDTIDALTKQDTEKNDYEAFIERVAQNPLAVRVKLLDLYDNIDVKRLPELGQWELDRTAKYHRAIQRLRRVDTSIIDPQYYA